MSDQPLLDGKPFELQTMNRCTWDGLRKLQREVSHIIPSNHVVRKSEPALADALMFALADAEVSGVDLATVLDRRIIERREAMRYLREMHDDAH